MEKQQNVFRRVINAVRNKPEVVTNQTEWSNDFLRNGSYKARTAVALDKKSEPELTIQGWMYAALTVRADSFAEFCEENIITENDFKEVAVHKYLDLIENSNKEPEYEFWHSVISDYDIYGEVFLFVLRRVVYDEENDPYRPGRKIKTLHHIGLPTAIEVLDAKNVAVLKNVHGDIVGYREMVDPTHKREFLPEQVIHIMNPYPLNRRRPYSIYEAALDYQYTINKGTEFAQNALVNNMNTPGILSTTETLNDEEYDNLVSRINGHEPGKVIVTDSMSGVEYKPMTQEIDKAALPDLNEVSRQTIFAVTGTSKTILGIEESGTTRDTSKVQEKKFIKRTIAPVAKRVIAALNFDYRKYYREYWKSNHVKLIIKAIYDPVETQEIFTTQKLLFDSCNEIVDAGYTKESAEEFLYGDLNYTELEEEEVKEEDISDEEQHDSEDSENSEKNGSSQDDSTSENSKKNNKIALNAHFSNEGVIDDYGQYVESKISSRKQQFLSEIKSIQLEAINNAISHLTVNELSEENITTKKERTTIFDKLYEAIKKYWLFLVPIIGSNRLQEDEENTQYKRKSPINLLGTSWIQKDIDKNAGKAAKSHTDTIYKTIVNAGKKAEEKIFSRLFADYYKKKYDENPEGENQFFKTEPTITQIKSKLKNPEFVSKNQDIIDFVRKEIEEGKHVQEIQKEIRSTYSTLSNGRAKTLVNTETSRATVRSQYDADYEFLKNIGKLDKAYKVLESNTGDPCPICAAIISKGEIPFTKEFVELGDSVTVSEGDKSITMTFDYEPVEAGCIHPNCHCSYRLMIK